MAIRECAVCGKPIKNSYVEDFWGNRYHAEHLKDYQPCDYCGRVISKRSTGGGSTYEDGRKICAICRSEAVEKRDEGIKILYEARDLLEKSGIVLKPFNPSFSILDRKTLKKYSRSGEEQGFTHAQKKSDGEGNILDLRIRVYVLHGLPYHAFLATSAHELMHAWIHLNGRNDGKKWFKEGSCNMAAYLALRHKQDLKAEYQIFQMRKQKDKVYGKGFRKVLQYVHRHGIQAWLNVLEKRKRLPLL